jgi:site-specific DNA recombinase
MARKSTKPRHASRTLAVGYVRVSTLAQAEDGVSLDAQRARIAAWAAQTGRELVGLHADEGVSGARADREGLQAAIAQAEATGAALVVYSLSRLARSTRHALETAERLERAGADLVSLSEQIDTTSACGKMIFRVLAVLAEFERDLTCERTTAALAHKRASRERVTRAVYGWDVAEDGRTMVPSEREQAGIARMRALAAEGLSLRAIGAALAAEGFAPKSGGAWHAKVIRDVLARAEAAVG